MNKRVLISNDSINAYGFRVLTEGINIEQYRRNPILLFMHRRPLGDDVDQILPLGHVEDLEVVDGALYGTIVIEPVDDFSSKIKKQWDAGTLKMVSPCLEEIEWSEDQKYILPGQRGATVLKCRLMEVSIVDIGANDDALQLRNSNGAVITLSNIPQITFNNNDKKMKFNNDLAEALSLESTASEDLILATVKKNALELQSLKKEVESAKAVRIDQMISLAKQDGRISADNEAKFIRLGKEVGVDALLLALESIPTPDRAIRPSGIILTSKAESNTVKASKLSDLNEKEIISLRTEDPETYAKLYKAEYGLDLSIE